MKKILIAFLLAMPFAGMAQTPTRLDTLFIKGEINQEEYDLLKKREPATIQANKYDSLRAAGKISEAEYQLLKKKALELRPENKELTRLWRASKTELVTGIVGFSLSAVLFSVVGALAEAGHVQGTVITSVPATISLGVGIGFTVQSVRNRKKARALEAKIKLL